jgi:hypothetical protein
MVFTPPLASRVEAMKRPTHHQFVPGIGYLVHSGPPDLPPEANGKKNCLPPTGTADGSVHMLKPPTGADPIAFRWNQADQSWISTRPAKGNRLAWPASHLQRAGWEYAEAKAGSRKKG